MPTREMSTESGVGVAPQVVSVGWDAVHLSVSVSLLLPAGVSVNGVVAVQVRACGLSVERPRLEQRHAIDVGGVGLLVAGLGSAAETVRLTQNPQRGHVQAGEDVEASPPRLVTAGSATGSRGAPADGWRENRRRMPPVVGAAELAGAASAELRARRRRG